MESILKYLFEETKKTLEEQVENVDRINEQRNIEENEKKAEYERRKASGNYSQAGLENYLSSYTYKNQYREMLRRSIELRKPKIEHNIEQIRKCFEQYFNGVLNTDLSNKIIAYKQLGVKLSDKEMQMLEKSTDSYADKRLFAQYAKDIGYNYEERLEYDGISNALDDYIYSAMNVFNYGGERGELAQYIDTYTKDAVGNDKAITGLDKALSSSANAFVTKDATQRFIDFLNNTGIDMTIEPLTDEENELIDNLIGDYETPYMIEHEIDKYKDNTVIRDLLLRHDDYRKYLL